MSLSVYLIRKRYLSYDQGKTYIQDNEQIYWANITHNLCSMAVESGLFQAIWEPYNLELCTNVEEETISEIGSKIIQTIKALDIIPLLEKGLIELKQRPKHFRKFNPSNGWGNLESFILFTEKYLECCKKYPDAIVDVSA